MEQWEIEMLHKQGKMPDWIYYQQIDKPIWLKIEEQKQKLIEQIQERQQEEEIKRELENQVAEILESLIKELY